MTNPPADREPNVASLLPPMTNRGVPPDVRQFTEPCSL